MLDNAVANVGSKLNSYLAENYKPGAYGEMQGYLAAQKEKRDQNQDNREERVLDMQEEKFGWARDAHKQEQIIQAGMAAAANDGGYEGVVAYLQKNDPERALKFHDMKLDLDSKIMKNSVMSNITIPSMREDALLESYEKLGKLGQALLKAPPEERQAMYSNLLPIAKVINPDMPDNLNDAVPVFMLSAAQATPASQLFAANSGIVKANSALGKLGQDIEAYKKAGVTPDDGTDQGDTLSSLLSEQAKWKDNALASTLKMNKTMLSFENDKFKNTIAVTKNLESQSVINQKYVENYSAIQGAFKELQTHPDNPQAMEKLARSFVKMSTGAQSSDFDSKIAYGARGYKQLEMVVDSYLHGKAVPLNKDDRDALESLTSSVHNEILSNQIGIEEQFATQAQNFPNQVSWDDVIKPSKYLQDKLTQNTADNLVLDGNIPDDVKRRAENVIKRGGDPRAVKQRVMQMMQQQAERAKQTNNPTLTPADYQEE